MRWAVLVFTITTLVLDIISINESIRHSRRFLRFLPQLHLPNRAYIPFVLAPDIMAIALFTILLWTRMRLPDLLAAWSGEFKSKRTGRRRRVLGAYGAQGTLDKMSNLSTSHVWSEEDRDEVEVEEVFEEELEGLSEQEDDEEQSQISITDTSFQSEVGGPDHSDEVKGTLMRLNNRLTEKQGDRTPKPSLQGSNSRRNCHNRWIIKHGADHDLDKVIDSDSETQNDPHQAYKDLLLDLLTSHSPHISVLCEVFATRPGHNFEGAG
ncbi:hypothetical protein BGZ82_008189 [Podila clonocystis]|nr:hypothetical protein BGZ82_008189 [Podila clonocystis]